MPNTITDLNKQLDDLYEDIARRASDIDWNEPLLGSVSLTKERLAPAELGLLRITSWLYAMYFEVGRTNIEFLARHLELIDEQEAKFAQQHLSLVHQLRTFMQHHLEIARPRDRDIFEACQLWFAEVSQTSEPAVDNEWQLCLGEILGAANRFISALVTSVDSIIDDENTEEILSDWRFFLDRRIAPQEFDRIVAEAAQDMGRDFLDATTLRKRYYERWSKELENMRSDRDPRVEARKLVEWTLLNDIKGVLPITGGDVMDYFENVESGPIVGKLLDLATDIYRKSPCDKKSLLKELKQESDKVPDFFVV